MTADKITKKLGITRQYISLLRYSIPLKRNKDFTSTKLGARTYYDYTATGLAKIKTAIKKLK